MSAYILDGSLGSGKPLGVSFIIVTKLVLVRIVFISFPGVLDIGVVAVVVVVPAVVMVVLIVDVTSMESVVSLDDKLVVWRFSRLYFLVRYFGCSSPDSDDSTLPDSTLAEEA